MWWSRLVGDLGEVEVVFEAVDATLLVEEFVSGGDFCGNVFDEYG